MAGVAEYLATAGPAGYVDVAGYTMRIGTTAVAGYAVRGGPAGTVRQHASDGLYEPTTCSGVNAGFDTAGVANGARGVARQIDPAWADIGSVGLYHIAGSVHSAS